jgi:hypothetical protein
MRKQARAAAIGASAARLARASHALGRATIVASLAWLGCTTTIDSEETREPAPLHLPDLAGSNARPTQLLFVSVAGLTPEHYRATADGFRAMPLLARLARAGVSADAVVPVVPPAVYPAHATLVTGVSAGVHGVVADRRIGERGVRSIRYSHASLLRVPTLWQRAAEARLRVASLGWPSTVGASIPLLLPDVEVTRRGETWASLLESAATPELAAMVRRNPELAQAANAPGSARDAILVNTTCELLRGELRPRLLFVRLSQSEPIIARYGADADETRAAFQRIDGEIDHLLRCAGEAAPLGVTAIVVTGDHGSLPVHTRIAPNAELVREQLIGVQRETRAGNGAVSVREWLAIVRSNGGSAFVYAQSEAAALRAREVLEREARATRSFRVVSAEELVSYRADPEAWFGLEAAPGYAFDDSVALPLLSPAARRAAGGYLPSQSAMSPGFVAWGRGLRTSRRIPSMRQTDIAPTVTRLLGLGLGGSEGRALIGILSAGGS